MYMCDKNFCCCGWQYYDREDDVEEEAKDCGHLIEVDIVRHAKWVHYQDTSGDILCDAVYCSNCKWNDGVYEDDLYCSHCGAKMDLK